jgi:hypothetical protein
LFFYFGLKIRKKRIKKNKKIKKRIIIPLRAKRVGEFIKNGHKKISPNRVGSGSGVTL